ncbi:putative flavanone 3-dioxygenase [Helianthus debilis subsp. tardiflorus]
MNTQLGKHAQHMVLNYYPPCPQPNLTYGLPGQTDPNFIIILLQDKVPSLQVLKDGKWVAVDPVPNTFIINIGDQVQVMSNDKYKSILHLAVVNCDKERISIPTFYRPSPEAVIGPASEVVSDDDPAVYRQFTFGEYYEKFNGLEKCLDMFKTSCLLKIIGLPNCFE